MDIKSIRSNLDFLREYYGDDKLVKFIHYFGYSTRGDRLVSVIDPSFRQAVREIKEAIGYEGDAYSFSDYPTNLNARPVIELGEFLEDVENIIKEK